MIHSCNLLQRSDWSWFAPVFQKVPVGKQFFLMKLRPRFDQTLLAYWQKSNNKADRRDRKHSDVFAVVGMKMGSTMALGRLREHANDDAVKSGKLRLFRSLSD